MIFTIYKFQCCNIMKGLVMSSTNQAIGSLFLQRKVTWQFLWLSDGGLDSTWGNYSGTRVVEHTKD